MDILKVTQVILDEVGAIDEKMYVLGGPVEAGEEVIGELSNEAKKLNAVISSFCTQFNHLMVDYDAALRGSEREADLGYQMQCLHRKIELMHVLQWHVIYSNFGDLVKARGEGGVGIRDGYKVVLLPRVQKGPLVGPDGMHMC